MCIRYLSYKFLSFIISQRRIEANLKKIKALLGMQVLKTQKDVQSLTGRVVDFGPYLVPFSLENDPQLYTDLIA